MHHHDDEFVPDTEPRGDLDPPRRPPPTAVGAGTPEEEERRPAELYDRARFRNRAVRRPPAPVRLVGALIRGLRRVVAAGRP